MGLEERGPLGRLSEPFEGLVVPRLGLVIAGVVGLGAVAWALTVAGACPSGVPGYLVLVAAEEGLVVLIVAVVFFVLARFGGREGPASVTERNAMLGVAGMIAFGALYVFAGGPGRHSTTWTPFLPRTPAEAWERLCFNAVLTLILAGYLVLVGAGVGGYQAIARARRRAARHGPLDLSGD
jgi:hypothetical protein